MHIKISSIQKALIFLVSIEFLQQENVLFALLSFISLVIMVKEQRSIKLNVELILLILAFTLYYFISVVRGEAITAFGMIRYWIGPIAAYIIGQQVVDGSQNKLVKLILCIALGRFFHGALNLFITRDLSVSNRYVINVWTAEVLSATLQGTFFTMAIVVSVVWIFEKSKKKKIAGLFCISVAIANAMMTGSRTAIVLVITAMIVMLMVRAYYKNPKSVVKAALRTALIVVALLIMGMLLYHYNIMGIRTAFENSLLGIRLENIDREDSMSRSQIWIWGIQKVLVNPWGQDVDRYAHNMWLDVGLDSGALPMSLLVVYTVISYKNLLKGIRKNMFTMRMGELVIPLYVVVFFNFMVEPILQGIPFMAHMFFMINGAVYSCYSAAKTRRLERIEE